MPQTIRAGLKLKAITPARLKRVNIDTTVEQKLIRFPTDSRLYDRARERLVNVARKEGIDLRQSYTRVGKRLLHEQSRYPMPANPNGRNAARKNGAPCWAG